MADLSEYMTPDEFAALPAGAHHAVWRAVHEHRIDVIRRGQGDPYRYHREQVRALLAGLEAPVVKTEKHPTVTVTRPA